MYRRFEFEGPIHASLSCVPLVVRRKLDLAALKISLAGWQALPREERLALCHLPVDTEEELAIYGEVLRGFAARAGITLGPLPPERREAWSTAAALSRIEDRIGKSEAITEARLSALSEEERYAIVKLCEPRREPEKLRLLLAELDLAAG